MKQIVLEAKESPEGGFEASALGLRIHTRGGTWNELKEMVKDAVRAHFEPSEMPSSIHTVFSKSLL